MKIVFDKEKAKEWVTVVKDVAWRPDVMLAAGMFGGVAIANLIYSLTPRLTPGTREFVDIASDIWKDMPIGVNYQAYKITPEMTDKLHNPLFFLISEEDDETKDFAK